jgi:quercetin dioxygenase-like cupin family protein
METATEPPYTLVPDLGGLASALPDSIVSRTFHKDHAVRAVFFAFAPGQELSEHTASTAAILHVLSGEARLTLGADVHHVTAGAWVWMRPGLPHSLRAKTPVQMLLLLLQGFATIASDGA